MEIGADIQSETDSTGNDDFTHGVLSTYVPIDVSLQAAIPLTKPTINMPGMNS